MSDTDSDVEFMGDSDDYSVETFVGESDNDNHDFLNNSDYSDTDSTDSFTDSDGASYLSVDDVDLNPEALMEETEFLDEEDAEAFRGVSVHHYRTVILPLKASVAPLFFNYTFHSQLTDDGIGRLGMFLARTEHLVQLHMKFEEEQPQSVGLVFRGPFHLDNALRRFKIGSAGNPVRLSLNDWGCISRYLRVAPSLRHLDLSDLSLSRGEVELLASVLEGIKLKTLGLTMFRTRDEEDDSFELLFSSMNVAKLETIDIVDCDAGVSACRGLANILHNGESKLEILNLDSNCIDDSCVEVLCQSLSENTTLEVLRINDNEGITDEGWNFFEKLVFDMSNLECIYKSNHTLRHLAGHPRPQSFHVNGERRACNKGHEKIISFLTNDSVDFNIEPFVDFGVEMMPYVLKFFGNFQHLTHNSATLSPCCVTYRIIRRWNMPELFCFPSAERVRLSAKMNELEKKNCDLLREMELLKLENSRLKSENNLFQLESQSSNKRNQFSKRTRLN